MRCLCMYPWKKLVYAQYYRMDFFPHSNIISRSCYSSWRKRREKKSSRIFFHTWQIWQHQSIEGKMLEKVSLMKFAGRCCLRTDTLINLFFFVRKAQNYCMKLEKINKFHAAHKHKKKKNRVTHSKSSHEWDFLAHKKK